jgi:uncharacterized protein GlcG (DUF336 family)
MNEKQIAEIVDLVTRQMKEQAPSHICKAEMTLATANDLIEKVKAEANKIGVNAVVAVSDAAGRPISIQCMDEAYIASFDVALNKTYTSASLKMSTEALGKLAEPGASLYGIQFTNEGKIVIFGGGEPLYRGGKIVGALGVSGGSAEQDTYLAAYGKKIFEQYES